MKTFWRVVLWIGLIGLIGRSGLIGAEETPTMPSEVTLTSGRVLRNVTVIRWEKERVVLRHAAGADPIAFSLVAEPLRSQLPAIRAAGAALIEAKKTEAAKVYSVSGQVFVTTRGAQSYKFAGAHVRLFSEADFAMTEQRALNNLPSNFRRMTPEEQEIAIGSAWSAALESVKEITRATTDADGNYTLTAPSGNYFVACLAGRLVGRAREQNVWVLPAATPFPARLDLNGGNQYRVRE